MKLTVLFESEGVKRDIQMDLPTEDFMTLPLLELVKRYFGPAVYAERHKQRGDWGPQGCPPGWSVRDFPPIAYFPTDLTTEQLERL